MQCRMSFSDAKIINMEHISITISSLEPLPFPPPCSLFPDIDRQGLLDVAFGPMFGESGSPDYFYLSYTGEFDDGVSYCIAVVVVVT